MVLCHASMIQFNKVGGEKKKKKSKSKQQRLQGLYSDAEGPFGHNFWNSLFVVATLFNPDVLQLCILGCGGIKLNRINGLTWTSITPSFEPSVFIISTIDTSN